MIDTFLQIILSNMVVSLGLAVVAMVVGLTIKRPRLTHLLWLLVLLKLVTPPVVTIPVAAIPAQIDQSIVSMEEYSQPGLIAPGTEENTASSIGLWLVELINHTNKVYLFWLLGSAFVLSLSLTRVYRFNNLLRKESRVAPDKYQSLATRIADQLGLKAIPTIYTTSAQLSPMVWWIGGEVRIVIPETLSDQMDTGQFQWILAHELAHVRRKDYIVRWIEWLVCVCFWWNPVVYWAKYYLRANEELCCDALVVSSLQLKPHSYADSLLKAFEYLASPIIRPPAMASEIYSGGFLKRRFSMIVSSNFTRSIPRWMLACVLLSAAVVLTLGFGCESGDPIANSGELARLNAVDRGDSNPERGRDKKAWHQFRDVQQDHRRFKRWWDSQRAY
jgi:beta-lactamase regulating signal transducer with metallopeptidase domain